MQKITVAAVTMNCKPDDVSGNVLRTIEWAKKVGKINF